jgi:hypothetical protein
MPIFGLHSPAFLGAMAGRPGIISDGFNRANSSDLGVTPTGGVPWQQLRGSWDIYNSRLRNTSGTDAVAAVDAGTANAEVRLDVSPTGADCIVFRASNADNWARLSHYYETSSGQRAVYLETMMNGNLTVVDAWWVGITTRLRVLANDDFVTLYAGAGNSFVQGLTLTFNQSATLFGAGRRSVGGQGTAIDNFFLEPIT